MKRCDSAEITITYFDAGLPNIFGGSNCAVHYVNREDGARAINEKILASGAFKASTVWYFDIVHKVPVMADHSKGAVLNFDASLWNPIYSNSVTTVQPSAASVNYFIRAR